MVQHKTKRRKRTGLWQILLVVFLFALAAFVIFKSPLFEIKKIGVTGNRQVEASKIIAASGIHSGINIFKVNLKEAHSRLSLMPILKDVQLERDFPDGIIITVKERNPVAFLPDNNGFIQLDKDRVYIKKSQSLTGELPVITGVEAIASGPGEIVKGEGLAAALQVVVELPQELVQRLSEVHYQDNGSFVLYTVEGNQCRLGTPEQVAAKGNLFLQVLRELEGKHAQIEYVDLSFIGTPVVKYKG